MIRVSAIRKAQAINPVTQAVVPQIELSLSNGMKIILLYDKRDGAPTYNAQYKNIVKLGGVELTRRLDVRTSEIEGRLTTFAILSQKEYSDEVIFDVD